MLSEYTVEGMDQESVYTYSVYRYEDRADIGWGEEQDIENGTVQLPNEVDHLELLVIKHCYRRNHKLSVSAAAIQSMKTLTVLKLNGCQIHGEVRTMFKDMHRLSILKIKNSIVDSAGLLLGISTLTSLQSLTLESIDRPEDLNEDSNDRLIIDQMSDLKLVSIHDISMKYLPVPPPSIQTYYLVQYSSNQLIEGTVDSIDWSRYKLLRILTISGTDLRGTVPNSILSLESLSELDLSDNRMSSCTNIPSHLEYIDLQQKMD